jgi:release factor glutamine methyltransferase
MSQIFEWTMHGYPKIAGCEGVYGPREDSFLLADAVGEYGLGRMLDLGSGTGIVGITAALKGCEVTFADISGEAIECSKKNASANNVAGSFVISDMFSKVGGKFNTIAFNPPYLPSRGRENVLEDRALDGGAGGRELIDRFLCGFRKHILGDHAVLLLESSLNGYKDDADLFEAEIVARKRMFFEELVVLLIR